MLFRASIGRPALTGATALAIVSASTAAVAAETGAPGSVVDRFGTAGAASAHEIVLTPPFGVTQGRSTRRVYDGWGASQFGCLNSLWMRESKWSVHATNPTSGAYGIPQALPGSKMASAGPNWRTNAITQIAWGLGYIRARYGSPCGAWSHSEGHGWY